MFFPQKYQQFQINLRFWEKFTMALSHQNNACEMHCGISTHLHTNGEHLHESQKDSKLQCVHSSKLQQSLPDIEGVDFGCYF